MLNKRSGAALEDMFYATDSGQKVAYKPLVRVLCYIYEA
jgi:hypothetical protein